MGSMRGILIKANKILVAMGDRGGFGSMGKKTLKTKKRTPEQSVKRKPTPISLTSKNKKQKRENKMITMQRNY